MKLATAKLLIALFVAAAFQIVLWLAPGSEAPPAYASHGLPHATVTLWRLLDTANPIGFNPTETDDDTGGVTGHVATSTSKLTIVTIVNNSLHPNGRANGIVFWNPATNDFKAYAVVPAGFSAGIDVNLRAPVLTGAGRTFQPGDVWVSVQAPDGGGPLYVNFKGSDIFRQYFLVDAAGAANGVKGVVIDQTTGHVFFTDENPPGTINRLNPATNQWTRWEVGGIPGYITVDSVGRVYATVSQSTLLTPAADAIVQIDPRPGLPTSNQVTAWRVPGDNNFCPGQCPVSAGSLPETPNGIDLDGAGDVWFVESQSNEVGRLEPGTGRITEFTGVDPTPPNPGVNNPQMIGARGSGTTVESFFTEGDGEAVGRVRPQHSGPFVVTPIVQTLTTRILAPSFADETIAPQRTNIRPTAVNVASRAAGPDIVRFPMPTPRGGKTDLPRHPSGLTDVTSQLTIFGTYLDPARAGNSAVFRVFDPVDGPLPDPDPLLAPLLGWQRITGAGTIATASGTATFALAVDREQEGATPTGRLRYRNQATGDKVVSTAIGSVTVVGNTATIEGTCSNNDSPCTFTLVVQDLSEFGAADTFTIQGQGQGFPLASGGITLASGTLTSGNIVIHNK
jgi:hypothetical protein